MRQKCLPFTLTVGNVAIGLLIPLLTSIEVMAEQPIGPASARPVFALVIGNNQTVEGQSELRYADDDAVQNAAFVLQIGSAENVVLLTQLDKETAEMYPGLTPKPPSKKNLHHAMKRLNRAMQAEKARGATPEFFLFYTGHGNVKNNMGYFTLTDGIFTRDDLLTLVKHSEATRNHLIIDACKSYFMVFERGPGGKRRRVTGNLVSTDDLPENTGVFLSTSSAANSHEWEAISAGIFSHEVRSALRGGADLDLDQLVTYEEAAAFVWNANRAIPIKKYRPVFYMQPPGRESAGDSVLADLTKADGHWLHATPAKETRQYIEDDKGIRIAEFHPGAFQNIAILIPKERPLFLRTPDELVEYELPPSARVELTSLQATDAEVRTRGAEHLAFQKLFSAPFGAGEVVVYYTKRKTGEDTMWRHTQNATGSSLLDDGPPNSRWRTTLGLSGLLLAGAGGSLTLTAIHKKNVPKDDASGRATANRNDDIRRLNIGAISCYVAAGTALASWIIWTAATRKHPRLSQLGLSFSGTTLKMYF